MLETTTIVFIVARHIFGGDGRTTYEVFYQKEKADDRFAYLKKNYPLDYAFVTEATVVN